MLLVTFMLAFFRKFCSHISLVMYNVHHSTTTSQSSYTSSYFLISFEKVYKLLTQNSRNVATVFCVVNIQNKERNIDVL